MQTPAVSEHAVLRYMERTGCKSREKARTKIDFCFINGVKLKRNKNSDAQRIYGRGWVLVIKDNLIVTVYRPGTPDVRNKVHAAHRKKRAQEGRSSTQNSGRDQHASDAEK